MNFSKRPSSTQDWFQRQLDATDAFSPGAPIDDVNLLAGRTTQIDRMLDAVMQRGQHAMLYGERGVGKSSLANTFAVKLLGGARVLNCVPVNCHPSDDFSSVWRKVFRRLSVDGVDLASIYDRPIEPDDVVVEFEKFSLNTIPIVILDEFDKLSNKTARNLIANTITNLSDRSVRTTVILVGVADSVTQLIDEHASVYRCLRQIPMQRMFPSELRQIVTDRLPSLGMDIDPQALTQAVLLSRGLPHYTHLFAQQAAKKALERHSLIISLNDLADAFPECIVQTQQTVRQQYHKATMSPRRDNLYKEVLLAAALSQVDDLGYFAPTDLRQPLTSIIGSPATISLFGQHLKNLCMEDKGNILEQIGSPRRYRYRFVEPMMQPFILINGLRTNLINSSHIEGMANIQYEPKFAAEF